jgi:hypothetical protein
MFAFRKAFRELENRIKLLMSLPIDTLDPMALHARLREIGKSTSTAEPA